MRDLGADQRGNRVMVIETKRLIITTASQDEMISFINEQTDEILIKAYREMLQTRETAMLLKPLMRL